MDAESALTISEGLSAPAAAFEMSVGTGDVVVTRLNVFPVKSCRAVSVEEIEMDRFGVVGDRRFMIVDGDRFTSQRKLPRLALVTACYVDGGKRLKFSAPGMPDLVHQPVVEGERVDVSLWRDTVSVVDQGDAAAKWLNDHVGMGAAHLRLVAAAEHGGSYRRPIAGLYVPAKLQEKLADRHVSLTDCAPVSLVSEESLADLNRRLRERGGEEVGLKQFRMNIEVSGCSEAFGEDKWLVVQIGSASFLAYRRSTVYYIHTCRPPHYTGHSHMQSGGRVYPDRHYHCPTLQRCKMTGVHQDTGQQIKLPPLDILRTYRVPHGPARAEFGQLLLPLTTGGKIKIGDRVNVLEYTT